MPALTEVTPTTCEYRAATTIAQGDPAARLRTARRFAKQHSCPEHGRLSAPTTELVLSEIIASASSAQPIQVRIECHVTGTKVLARVAEPDAFSDHGPDQELRALLLSKVTRVHGTDVTDDAAVRWATIPSGYVPVHVPRQRGRIVTASELPLAGDPLPE